MLLPPSRRAWYRTRKGLANRVRRPVSRFCGIASAGLVTRVSDLAVTLFVLICAFGVALLSAAGAAVVVWRVRASADAQIADAVAQMAAGMHETMRELAEAVETARAAPEPERFVGELAATSTWTRSPSAPSRRRRRSLGSRQP